MIIKNADVYTQDNVFVKGDVVVDNGTFTKVLEAPDYVDNEVVDATGLKMIPGLVDIHFHGCKGADMGQRGSCHDRVFIHLEEADDL